MNGKTFENQSQEFAEFMSKYRRDQKMAVIGMLAIPLVMCICSGAYLAVR